MAELVLHIKRGRPHTGQQIISSASFLERQARELSYVWDSLVTADYLLTARDLPGWPGRPPAIDFRKLLLKGLAELKDGLFAHDRIARELSILYGIAERHGLGDFFRKVARNARRSLEGNAISSRRIYLDGSRLGIENVLDTAYFACNAHAMSGTLRPSILWHALTNSVRYRLLSLQRGPSLPEESEWIKAAQAPSAP
jgi:hypothetical protein